MKPKLERALKWLLPALAAAEIALVRFDLLSIQNAVVVVAAIEVLLFLLGARQVFIAIRNYRRGRTSGLDAWSALEDGVSAVLPRKVARFVVLEPRLWACLFRWASRKTKLREGEFGYHKKSTMYMLVLLVVLVGPVEALMLHLLVPWAWLRWSLLAVEVYGTFWFLGFHASLQALPHRLEETGVRLRYGAFAEVLVPYPEIGAVERSVRRTPGGGDGLRTVPEEDAAYLTITGKTDLTLKLKSPRTVEGVFRSVGPVGTMHLSADKPGLFAREIKKRIGEAGDTAPAEASTKARPAV